MTLSLVLDVLVAALLVVTISYAVVLNRRLKALRRDRDALERLAAGFGEATLRAGQSTLKLRSTADALSECIDKGEALRNDLRFLLERGTATADRLEDGIRASRTGAKAAAGAKDESAGERRVPAPEGKPARRTPQGEGEPQAASEAERQLFKALQSVR